MGQYWKPVNLTKREFINPHRLASGLKLWEILANDHVGKALVVLTAAMPEPRGGGDLQENPTIGRWAGDQIAIIGDYAEDSDLASSPVPASEIYGLCGEPDGFTDITDQVCAVIEKELEGKFVGEGWREFVED